MVASGFPGKCKLASYVTALILIVSNPGSAGPDTLIRDSIPESYKWDLSPIYPDWEAWEGDFTVVSSMIDSLATLAGYPSQGAEQLLATLRFKDSVGMMTDRLSLYAWLAYVTNMSDNLLSGNYQRIENIESRLAEAISWLEPELLEIPWDGIAGWQARAAGLDEYGYWLEDIFRLKEHYLNEAQEKLLAYFGPFNNSPEGVYSDFIYSDIQYPSYVTRDGDTILLTENQTWYQMRVNRDQDERRNMFRTFYEAYHGYVNTYAAIYNSVLQRDFGLARARNYDNALAAALDNDNVPVEIYRNLVTTVRQGTEPIKRYHRLRRQALGLDHYYWSDRKSPLVDFSRTYEFNEVVPWVIDATAPLGPDYQQEVRELTEQRRIDVYENESKYTGAFQSDAFGTPQYILMNFSGTLEDVFTLAHEMGHAIHSNYSNSHQTYVNAYSTIFVAEVPSTLNEALLLDYLLGQSEDPKERVAILQQAIENIAGTFYLQTMFADFEWQAHQLLEGGEPVTADALRGIYAGLLNDYFGDAIEMDSLYHSYWTRIGHFFESPYYVYKYATSYAASAKLVEGILSNDANLREEVLRRYFTLLRSGGNDYPMEQLKKAGVDMSTPDALQAVVTQLDNLVSRLETELDQL